MESTHPANPNRHAVIVRLRQQVATGSYRPPVDELVNRLVDVVIARRVLLRTRGIPPDLRPGRVGGFVPSPGRASPFETPGAGLTSKPHHAQQPVVAEHGAA